MNTFKKLPFLYAIIFLLSMVFSSFAAANEPEQLTVVSLGDSITFGWNLDGANQTAQSQKAFPFLIGTGSNEVLNVSAPGWTSTHLLSALKSSETGAMLQQADVITLNIGANDLMQAVELGEILASQQPIVPTEELLGKINAASAQLAANLQESIMLIRANTDAPIMLYSIYNPFGQSTDPFAASLHNLGELITTNVNNQVLGQIAALSGSIYLDAYSAFNGKQNEYIIPSDIHPTEAGHQALAQIATNKLVELQPKEIVIDPTLSTEEKTSEPVVVTIEEIEDVVEMKWLPGEKSSADFVEAGNAISGNSFEVKENGIYTIYVKTTTGEAITTIEISNIKAEIKDPVDEDKDPVDEEPPAEQPEENEPPAVEPVDTTPDKVDQTEREPTKNEETPKVEIVKEPIVKNGHALPNTATSNYSFLVAGLCLIVVGGVVFITQRTHKAKID